MTKHLSRDSIGVALAEGRVPVGMQCFSGSPPILEIIGHSGFDFVMIDTEHACIDSGQLEQLIRVCDSAALMPIVRVEQNAPTPIRKALEAGAEGIIVPQVRSVAEVEAIVGDCRYPPQGRRGSGPRVPTNYGRAEPVEFARTANQSVFVAV